LRSIVFPDSEARRTPVATLALDCDSVEDAVTAISYSDTLVCRHLVIRGLGVVIVDADRSDTSRAFVQQVAGSPGLSIVERAGDLASAALAGLPADFGKLISEEAEKWGKVIRAANIKPEG